MIREAGGRRGGREVDPANGEPFDGRRDEVGDSAHDEDARVFLDELAELPGERRGLGRRGRRGEEDGHRDAEALEPPRPASAWGAPYPGR